MPPWTVRKTISKRPSARVSFERLTPAARNRIIGMSLAGAPRADMRDKVRKTDGRPPSLRAVDGILARFAADPQWDGSDSSAGGRPRQLSPAQEKQILRILVRDVGKFVVTARYVKKKLRSTRGVRDDVIRETFRRLGYGYRDRRGKRAIARKYKPSRLAYCDWLLKQTQAYLNTFAYTDGTTFFLAADDAQHDDKQRAALGKKVWRRTDGKDSLQDKNVGASSYAKSQGEPVKIWGLLANGRLEYILLPEVRDKKGRTRSANMTGKRYHEMVETHFCKWRKKMFPRLGKRQIPLVKDFERFLRQERNLKAEVAAGYKTVDLHPKCSPDLNAIENAWRLLQDRLLLTAPVEEESRSEFVKRLRRTVHWMNDNARKHMRALCQDQKKRAAAVKKLQGARCSY